MLKNERSVKKIPADDNKREEDADEYEGHNNKMKKENRKISDWYKISIAKHGLATREFYSSDKWTNMLKSNDYVDIQVNDITLNVSKVLPKWIGLIQENENKLLHLYPKIFLTMLK